MAEKKTAYKKFREAQNDLTYSAEQFGKSIVNHRNANGSFSDIRIWETRVLDAALAFAKAAEGYKEKEDATKEE